MKGLLRDLAGAFFVGMVIPYLIVNCAFLMELRNKVQTEIQQTEPAPELVPAGITVCIGEESDRVSMDMEQYLVGVVLAEMPASFEPEALKAQAVAARTYTSKAIQTGGKHGDGSLCVESTCCQAYMDEETFLSRGGTQTDLNKVRKAVWSTAGQVMIYEGALIEATYFSCSGGRTENAVEVWGTEYPYLVSVESPGEEEAAYYREEVLFSPEEMALLLNRELTGPVKDWFEQVVYTEGGSVSAAVICGKTYTGTQLRSILGLRSAAFSVDILDETICITTKGYGHRVGLSQYGADAMAVKGSGYEEILAHYYPGTEIVFLHIDENEEIRYHEAYAFAMTEKG